MYRDLVSVLYATEQNNYTTEIFFHKFRVINDFQWINKLCLHRNDVVLQVEELLWILFNSAKKTRSWESDSWLACKDIIRGKVKNYPHFCFSNLFTQK
jgi:hypothetical protein